MSGFRPAWAEVDLAALRHNVGVVVAAAQGAEVCAVVKADGYGHGAVAVATAALDAGAGSLAVALVEEGAALRAAGIAAPIVLLSEPPPGSEAEVVARGLTPTVYSVAAIDALASSASARPASDALLGVQLKVDTGMHRVGAPPGEVVDLARRIHGHQRLALDGVWTHFAVADESTAEAKAFTAEQQRRFEGACDAIESAGMRVPRRHASNAAGTLYARALYDLVRPGIALYGYEPDPSRETELQPVLSLKACVTHVKDLKAGERVSYGLRYELATPARIATVPLGYADGVPRRLSTNGATVLVGGEHRPIAGTITMDQFLVDCGPGSAVTVGDEVVLLGRQGDAVITADDWAQRLDTISYEILCGIGPRVPRVYLG